MFPLISKIIFIVMLILTWNLCIQYLQVILCFHSFSLTTRSQFVVFWFSYSRRQIKWVLPRALPIQSWWPATTMSLYPVTSLCGRFPPDTAVAFQVNLHPLVTCDSQIPGFVLYLSRFSRVCVFTLGWRSSSILSRLHRYRPCVSGLCITIARALNHIQFLTNHSYLK